MTFFWGGTWLKTLSFYLKQQYLALWLSAGFWRTRLTSSLGRRPNLYGGRNPPRGARCPHSARSPAAGDQYPPLLDDFFQLTPAKYPKRSYRVRLPPLGILSSPHD